MTDRISELEATARRLEGELGELRAALAALRTEGRESPAPNPAASRIDVFNEALRAQSAEGAGQSAGGEPASAAGPGPAKTWDEVMRNLGVRGAHVRPAPPSPASQRARNEGPGLEDLVGRYGTIALASLTILMGIGALIGWAVRNGYIGPTVRIVLGLVAAAVLAAFGWRVRKGDSPRYGNALLALSLAVVHVVSWGAGPRLHIINTPAVLALAALASTALALLAWHEDDQTLFNVGFGGALLAPFVTSTGGGNAILLLSYGFVVLGTGIASLGQRSWSKTPFVAVAGVVLFTATAVTLVDESVRWVVANAPAAFALGLSGLASVLLDGRKRMAITYPSLLAALVALMAVANGRGNDDPQFAFAMALAVAARYAGGASHRGLRTALLGAIVLPVGALAVALGSLDDVTSVMGVATAMLFASLSTLWSWQDAAGERGTHAFTATAMGGLAIALGTADEQRLAFCLLVSAFGLLCAWATRRFKLGGIGLAGALWLAVATMMAFDMLATRPVYEYRPFLTTASLAAAAVSAAWLVLSFHTARNLPERSVLAQELPRSVIRVLGGVVAFVWIRQELARAFSPDLSAFLLVAYYASVGIGSIFLGRARELPLLRQLGLALSVFAALTAITEATSLAIGWRVASYLLAGVFLLAVAYSYRITRQDAPDGRSQVPEGSSAGGTPAPDGGEGVLKAPIAEP